MTKDEALKAAIKAMENSNSISYEMMYAITAINEALAQPPEPRNFCPRCGKRLVGMAFAAGGTHTCTPPRGSEMT